MPNLEVMGAVALVVAVAAVSMMVLLLRNKRTNRDLPIWLSSTIVGILVGAAGSAALATGLGYKIAKPRHGDVPFSPTPTPEIAMPEGGGPPAMGGGGPGMGMGMGPGMGGGRTPKRQLTTLVRKLELLTGDIKLTLTPEQSAAIATMLDGLKSSPQLTDEEANAKYEQLLALLDDDQKAKQDAIGLPFRRGGGGGFGGPGGPGGGPGGPGGGPGGGQPPDANPFSEEENAKVLSALIERLGGTNNIAPAIAAPAEPAQPAKDESEKKSVEK